MRQLILKFTLLVMLTLCLLCQRTSGLELSPQPAFVCLSREQSEKTAMCFEENLACHVALAKTAEPQKASWEITALGVLAGVLGGMVLSAQLH